ncbi:DUF1343 domain-containing protein [Bacillus licheniformis]|nr:DUF1343 domain-containing protein [Bacillus licheniformis]
MELYVTNRSAFKPVNTGIAIIKTVHDLYPDDFEFLPSGTMFFEDTGLPFVLPSPNMPTPDTSIVYPGTGLIEGTNMSEGRGTTKPFELIGAPYMKSTELAEKLNVLDRPNPQNGLKVEGPVLDPDYSSFVGMYPVPLSHGMTAGELAKLFNDEFNIGADLTVIKMKGWKRHSYIDEKTGLPVYSLYGDTRKPTPEMLKNVDVLLFDIQDVGTRFYTYIYTMAYAMEAAKENDIPFIVGIEVLMNKKSILKGKRVGLITNPTGVNSTLTSSIDLLHQAPGIELTALYGPEHGVRGDAQAGDKVGSFSHAPRGNPLPVWLRIEY